MWPTISDLSWIKPGMDRSGLALTAFSLAACPRGSCTGGAPAAAAECLFRLIALP